MPYHTFAGVFDDNSFCKQFVTNGICLRKIFCFLCFFSLLDFGKDKALKFSVNAFRCLCALCIFQIQGKNFVKIFDQLVFCNIGSCLLLTDHIKQ